MYSGVHSISFDLIRRISQAGLTEKELRGVTTTENALCPDEMFSKCNMASSDAVDLITDVNNPPSQSEKPYKCSYCKKSFTQSGHLTTHVRTHTGDRPFQCPYCPKAFTDRGNLNTHIRTHTGEKPFKCELCEKAFTFHIQLSRHKKVCMSSNTNSTLSFPVDEKNNNYNTTVTVANQPQFNNFIPDISPIQSAPFSENSLYSTPSSFILGECSDDMQPPTNLFFSKNEANKTVSGFHNESTPPSNPYGDTKDSSSNCGASKDFREISVDTVVSSCSLLNTEAYDLYKSEDESLPYTNVSKHEKQKFHSQTNSIYVAANMTNTGFNSEQIEESATSSSQKNARLSETIKYDKIIYIDSDSPNGTPEEVKSTFDANTVPENEVLSSDPSDRLSGSEKTTTDIGNQEDLINSNTISKKPVHRKSVFCDVCKKTFQHSYQLVIHLNSHNCQKNFECKFCGKTFQQVTRLNSHLHTHTGAKPYKCSFCGKGFADRSNLKSHRRLHTGEKPFKCTLCFQEFTFHIQLNRHKRNCKAAEPVVLESNTSFSSPHDDDNNNNNDADTLPPTILIPSHVYNNINNSDTSYSIQLNPDFMKNCDNSKTLNNSVNSSCEVDSTLNQSDLIESGGKDNIVDLTVETPDNSTDEPNIWKTTDRSLLSRLSTFDGKLQDNASNQQMELASEFSKDCLRQCHIDLSEDYDNDLSTTTNCNSNTSDYSSLSSGSKSEEALLTCQYCYKSFSKKDDLDKHCKKSHSKFSLETFKVNANVKSNTKKPYTCKFCSKSFLQPSHLNAHIRTHTGDKPFTCQFCNKAFSNQSNLNTHMRLHTKVKPFKCLSCNQSFMFHIQLQRHKIKCFGNKNLSIQYPSKEKMSTIPLISQADKLSSFEQSGTALRNKESRHFISSVEEANGSSDSCYMETPSNTTLSLQINTANKTAKTNDCETHYSNSLSIAVMEENQVEIADVDETKGNGPEIKEEWKKHNISMSAEISQSDTADSLLKSKSTIEELTVTEKSIVESTPIDRSLELTDKNQIPLQSNLLSYHPGKKLFRCKYCKRNYLGLYLLSVHLRSHNFATSEKMFECALCKKSFQKAGQLNSHVRTHTGVKPFLCQYCGKAFADRSNLNTHRRTHTGEKPFKCLFCGKAFTFHIQLSRHKRVCKPSALAQIHHQYQKRTNSLQFPLQSTVEQTNLTNNSPSFSKKFGQSGDIFFSDKTTDRILTGNEIQFKDPLSVQVYNNQAESTMSYSTTSLQEEAELLDCNNRTVSSSKSDNLLLPRPDNSLEQAEQKPNFNYQDASSRKALELKTISTQQNLAERQCDPDVYSNDDPEKDIIKSSRFSEDQDSINNSLSTFMCNKISGTANKSYCNDNISRMSSSTQPGEEASSFVKPGMFCNDDDYVEMRSNVSSYTQRNDESLATNSSLFPCCYCGKVFKLVTTLAVHIRLHTGSKVYECEFCGETFYRFTDLAVHLKLHPQEIFFQCEYCDMTFSRDCHLRLHEKSHFLLKDGVLQESLAQKSLRQKLNNNNNNFICPICYCIFPNSFTLDNHLTTHTTGKLYRCQTCKQAFTFPQPFKRHIQECQQLMKNQESAFIPDPISTENSQPFSSQNVFRKDLLANKISREQPQPVGLFSNTGRLSSLAMELWKMPPNLDNINQHKKQQLTDNNSSVLLASSELDGNESLIVCNYCDRKFSSCKSLSLHLKTHNTNFSAKKVYRCELCMKLFFQQLLLDKHKRTHHNQNSYNLKRENLKCRFCAKTFQQMSHLKAHIRHHTGDKPFKCQYCGKAFSDRSNLNTHIRTHTGEKPFKCTNCRCAFTFHIQLTRHKRICQSPRDETDSTTVSGDRKQHDESRLAQTTSSFTHCFPESTSSCSISDVAQSTNEHSENINLESNLRIPLSPLFFSGNILEDNNLNQSKMLTSTNSTDQFAAKLSDASSKSDSRLSDRVLTTKSNSQSSTNFHINHYNTETDVLDCKPIIEEDANIYLQPNPTVSIKSEPFPPHEQLLVCPSAITSNMSNVPFNSDARDTSELDKFPDCAKEVDLKPDIVSVDYVKFQGDEISKRQIPTIDSIQVEENQHSMNDSFSDTNHSTCNSATNKSFEHVEDISDTNVNEENSSSKPLHSYTAVDCLFGSDMTIPENNDTHSLKPNHSEET